MYVLVSLKNKSEIDMIEGPEFINLQPLDINPLMTTCEIKVFYLGHNRNGSYINKETADKMAKTLRGTPIVARWIEQKEDYGDHGHVMHIEDGEVKFGINTLPYGFVSPDADIWYQKFTDTDEFGNKVERTYLMTTGYLWEGQFKEELAKVIAEGQPQSMELDSNSIDGHWAKDNNLGVEFFIINDAVFSKLCILGDDVEPCFEGSSVTASSEVEQKFSNNSNFSRTLYSMMNDLTDAMKRKGGLEMPKDKFAEQTETVEEEVKSTEFETAEETSEEEAEKDSVDYTNAEEAPKAEEASDEFKSEDDDKDDSEDEKDDVDDDDDDDKKKPASAHSLEEFEQLTTELESLRAEIKELREFKLTVENEQKDALIKSFPYNTLSQEDIAEVVEHKSDYSLEEIESKLAVIYVKKGVQFTAPETEKVEEAEKEEDITTFSLEDSGVAESLTELQEVLRNTLK